ncbi:hypothetical protein L208DRAFT_1382074 [Tricholoma matsutake]|nr:hypothetical protein L208DRAFT_1382074 [Tricholoma matsutake 945]
MLQPTCGQQLATSGLGKIFSSPVKCSEKQKMTTYVVPLGQDIKCHCLEKKLHTLESGLCLVKSEGFRVDQAKSEESRIEKQAAEVHEEVSNDLDELLGPDLVFDDIPSRSNSPKPQRVLPDKSVHSLFRKWSQPLQQPFFNLPPPCSQRVQEDVRERLAQFFVYSKIMS